MSKEKTTTGSVEDVRHKVCFDFSQEAYDRLNEIQEEAGAENQAEVIRNSLRLYDWFLNVQKEGGKVLREDSDGNQFKLEFNF